ncbi:putative endopeptidase precursor [mine drainage metagenome]|uniref:Putative endopeptidase n=1 Tax=mine drainage metagenome TaxID=410659 RepID=A0A1J5QF58_9ZZZZ
MSSRGLRLILPLVLASALTQVLVPVAANASPGTSLSAVQQRVDQLQTDAAAAAEAANGARVRLAALEHTLAGVQGQRAKESASLGALKRNLGLIAANAYKNGGVSSSLQLLFAQNPTEYLASASQLEVVTRSQGIQLRQFTSAELRLHQTSLVVVDRVKQVQVLQNQLAASAAMAQAKLGAAQRILNSLKASERKRYLAAQAARAAASRKTSLASAKLGNKISGRAGIALRFALQQIGKPYYFGAAGMRYWDCSGLTMVAFSRAGVSLPHSSQEQIHYGRRVSRGSLLPGDLVFFFRGVSHVGIYLGHGLIVDAPHPGRNVQVDALNSMPFAGAVRL